MPNRFVSLMHESWDDLDHSISGLDAAEASIKLPGSSSVAWSVAHVTQMLDSWIVGRFGGLPLHPIISDRAYRTGGDGMAGNWPAIVEGVAAVRAAADGVLAGVTEQELEWAVPYDGSIEYLRSGGLRLDYAIMRIAAHHFMHTGEIEAMRSRLGRPVFASRQWGLALL